MNEDPTAKPSVLILCYQFPPVNGTGARRPYFLARQLADEGHNVSVLTTLLPEGQPWTPGLQGIAVHRTPPTHVQRDTNALQRALARAHHKYRGRAWHGLLRVAADLLLPEGHIDRWDILPEEVEELLGRHDIVLATCPQWYPFRLGARLAKRWNAMFIADYRDPWNVLVPTLHLRGFTKYGSGVPGLLRNVKMRWAERRWPGSAFAVSAISQPLLENAIKANGVQRSMVVHGGYDPALKPTPFVPNERFTVVYTGRAYHQQDWEAVLQCVERMHASDPDLKDKLRIALYGVVSTDQGLLGRMAAVAVSTGVLELPPRLGREDTMRAQQTADALLHISLDDHYGSMPVKFLEYLGAGRPIILFIKDPDLEWEVLDSTRTGVTVQNSAALERLLTSRLLAWQAGRQWHIEPDRSKLDTFNYAYQMRLWTAQLRAWHSEFKSVGAPQRQLSATPTLQPASSTVATTKPSVLILSYQFPPVNGTGARRPYYLARQLANEGHRVSVLTSAIAETQPWLPNTSGITVMRTPLTWLQRDMNMPQRLLARFHHRMMGTVLHGPLRVIADLLLPLYHATRWDIGVKEIEDRLGRHDVIVATVPTWTPADHGLKLARRWRALLTIDYRDPFSIAIEEVHMDVVSGHGTGLPGVLRRMHFRRMERMFGRAAFALTAVSSAVLENAFRITGTDRGAVVHGGYDPSVVPPPPVKNDLFTVVYTGRIYPEQDWDLVLGTIERMAASDPDLSSKFRLRIIGAASVDERLLHRIKASAAQHDCIVVLPRMAREMALAQQHAADAVLHLAYKGRKGYVPVKFLEYLNAGRPLLLVSHEADDMERIVDETRVGSVLRSMDDLERAFKDSIAAHAENRALPFNPDHAALATFAYPHQMARWVELLNHWYAGKQ